MRITVDKNSFGAPSPCLAHLAKLAAKQAPSYLDCISYDSTVLYTCQLCSWCWFQLRSSKV